MIKMNYFARASPLGLLRPCKPLLLLAHTRNPPTLPPLLARFPSCVPLLAVFIGILGARGATDPDIAGRGLYVILWVCSSSFYCVHGESNSRLLGETATTHQCE